MGFVAAICTQCGAQISVDESKDAGICQHCGTAFVTEKVIKQYNSYVSNNYSGPNFFMGVNDIETDIRNADKLLELRDYERAKLQYEKIISNYPADHRGWWGMAKVKYRNLYFDTYKTVRGLLPLVTSSDEIDTLSQSDELQRALVCSPPQSIFVNEYNEYKERVQNTIYQLTKGTGTIDYSKLDNVRCVYGKNDRNYRIQIHYMKGKLYLLNGAASSSFCIYEVSDITEKQEMVSCRSVECEEREDRVIYAMKEETKIIGKITFMEDRVFIRLRTGYEGEFDCDRYHYKLYDFLPVAPNSPANHASILGVELFTPNRNFCNSLSRIENSCIARLQKKAQELELKRRLEEEKELRSEKRKNRLNRLFH